MQEIVYHTNYKLENTYWWFIARNDIVGKVIEKKCPGLAPGDELLDAGCGTGGFAGYIAQKYKVIGLDTSDLALDYCRKRGLNDLFCMTLGEFPAKDWNIKAITMLDVVEHIDDDASVVKEAFDILPGGGYFIAAVPAYQWLWSKHDEIHMHYRRYNKKAFLKLLKNAGFEIEYHSYFNFFLFLPAVLKRFISKIFGEKEPVSPVDEVSPFVNKILTSVFRFESKLLPAARFPFGVSFLAVGRKP